MPRLTSWIDANPWYRASPTKALDLKERSAVYLFCEQARYELKAGIVTTATKAFRFQGHGSWPARSVQKRPYRKDSHSTSGLKLIILLLLDAIPG